MDDCPSQHELRCLLDERLDPPDLDQIVIHVEICRRCQELLETLTAAQAWKSTLRDAMADADQECDPEDASSLADEVEEHSTCEVPGGAIAELISALDSPNGSKIRRTADSPDVNPERTITRSGPRRGRRGRHRPRSVAYVPSARLRDPGTAG